MKNDITAVITNYNYANYILDCLTSVASQTSPYTRIIIIDDSSADNSLSIIKKFIRSHQRPEMELISNKKNLGQGGCIARSLKRIKTPYVHFIDADDFLESNVISEVKYYLNRYSQKIGKIQFNLNVLHERDIKGLYVKKLVTGLYNFNWEAKTKGYYPSPPCTGNIYRVDQLMKFIPLIESSSICSDVTLNLAAVKECDILNLSEALGTYRIHGKNNFATTNMKSMISKTLYAYNLTRKSVNEIYSHNLKKKIREKFFIFLSEKLKLKKSSKNEGFFLSIFFALIYFFYKRNLFIRNCIHYGHLYKYF